MLSYVYMNFIPSCSIYITNNICMYMIYIHIDKSAISVIYLIKNIFK